MPDLIKFSNNELTRFINGIKACYAIPFIDGVEDYVLEAVLEYARGILGVDPVLAVRSKHLYDVVDKDKKIGWSVKSIQTRTKLKPCSSFELVIQRSDIYKKADTIGFNKGDLSENTDPQILGSALLKYWRLKVEGDAKKQAVENRRIFILLKESTNSNPRKFAIYEAPLEIHEESELVWAWSDTKSGLIGRSRLSNRPIYRWYPAQKQFFESFVLPEDASQFCIDIRRLKKEVVVKSLLSLLATL